MKNRIIAAAVAMVLILICLVPVLFFFLQDRDADYEIVCFGDSVMACYYGEGTIPYFIGEQTGRNTLNAAFGGMSMSVPYGESKAGDTSYLYSMVGLSKALLDGDFTLQVMGTRPSIYEYPEHWEEVAAELNRLDYDSVRYVIIEHGVNDYLLGKPLDDETDRYNVYTYAGALRTVIENVQKAIPNATIVLATPIYTYNEGLGKDCFEEDYGGGLLPEYVATEQKVAAEYGLICVDNFNGSGINRNNYKKYLYDGLHSHQDGNVLIAENIVKNVEGMRK